MSLAGEMPDIRDGVWDLIGDVLYIGSIEVKGKFFRRYREVVFPNGTIAAVNLSFDCNVSETVLDLAEGDEVEVDGTTYLFSRRIPSQGDESGLVILELVSA